MLAVKTYSRDYVDQCRARVESQLARYRALVSAARDLATDQVSPLERAFGEFYPVFFNTQVVVLDGYFANRLRAAEGKDGNPANEVRVLTASILENGGILAADSTIALKPESSVLGLEVGDPVVVTEEKFMHLAFAYFSEIEARYGE